MSGWRPALRIARRTVRRNLGRSLLVAVLVAVPVAGATMVDVVARSLGDGDRSASRIMGAADAVLVVTRWDDLAGFSPVNGIEGGGPRDRNRGPSTSRRWCRAERGWCRRRGRTT